MMTFKFGATSEFHLSQTHPVLVKLARKALSISTQDFSIICSYRGKQDQELAFKNGNTKVHYPNSAHNQTGPDGKPRACAIDVIPYPFKGWNDENGFHKIADAMIFASEVFGVAIRWGGDFNRDGNKTKSDSWDKPHFELHPWREWDKK